MDEQVEPVQHQERLGRLRPRDTQGAVASTRTYSRIVDVLRWLLPVVIVIGLGSILLWPMWQANQISGVMVDNVPNLMVEKLNLTGTDKQGQPYALTAERALQAVNTKNLVDLEKPKGELTLKSGAWVAGHADRGRIDQDSNKLWLGGAVELFHDKGYRFSSDEMNVDIKSSSAWGSQPITVQGNFGKIEGGGFRLLDGGKTIVITGPAHARLSLRNLSESDSKAPVSKPNHSKPNLNTSRSR